MQKMTHLLFQKMTTKFLWGDLGASPHNFFAVRQSPRAPMESAPMHRRQIWREDNVSKKTHMNKKPSCRWDSRLYCLSRTADYLAIDCC